MSEKLIKGSNGQWSLVKTDMGVKQRRATFQVTHNGLTYPHDTLEAAHSFAESRPGSKITQSHGPLNVKVGIISDTKK